MPFQRRFRSCPAFLIAQAVSLFLHAPPILQFRKNEKTFRNFAGPYSPAAVAEPEALHTFFRSNAPMSAITLINAGGQTNERRALPCFSETREQTAKKSTAGRSCTSPRSFYLCFRFPFIPVYFPFPALARKIQSPSLRSHAASPCPFSQSHPRVPGGERRLIRRSFAQRGTRPRPQNRTENPASSPTSGKAK